MEQKKRNPLHWFKSLKLSFKIMICVGVLIFCSNFAVLMILRTSAVRILHKNVSQQVEDQLTIALSAVSNTISDKASLMTAMTTQSYIADYMSIEDKSGVRYLSVTNNVHESIGMMVSTDTNVKFAALLPVNLKNVIYLGTEIKNPDIYSNLLENARDAESLQQTSVYINILEDTFAQPMLMLYCPVFEKYTFGDDPCAYLAVGLDVKKLSEYVSANSDTLNIRIMNGKGRVLLSDTVEEVGTYVDLYQSISSNSGELEQEGTIISYKKLSDLWIAEGSMTQEDMYGEMNRQVRFITLIILIFTFLALLVMGYVCKLLYRPMEEMLQIMGKVTDGNLDVQMEKYEQKDFQEISVSFNAMTAALKEQMQTIKEKEQENAEIRLNALHSQIKPHFLYNTLECIHWQSLMEGAGETARMIMALAKYYRIALSKGAEYVSLEKELEHVKSYMMIQNIRFDDIVTMEYEIPEELLRMEIPKITLQPLVENALYHGIKSEDNRKGHVRISAEEKNGSLLIKVADDGIGMEPEELEKLNQNIGVLINDGSYGIKNVHKRLEIRYGKGSGLFFEKNETGGITVMIRFPAVSVQQ